MVALTTVEKCQWHRVAQVPCPVGWGHSFSSLSITHEKGFYLSRVLALITTIPTIYIITLLHCHRDVTLWRWGDTALSPVVYFNVRCYPSLGYCSLA